MTNKNITSLAHASIRRNAFAPHKNDHIPARIKSKSLCEMHQVTSAKDELVNCDQNDDAIHMPIIGSISKIIKQHNQNQI